MTEMQQASYDNWRTADEALSEAVHAGDNEEIKAATKKLQEARQSMTPTQQDSR
jgi:hypothetical protein